MSSELHGEKLTPFIVAQAGSAVALPGAADTLTHVMRVAAAVATGVLATALGVGGTPPPRGSVQVCAAAAVRAIEHRVPLATVTAACRGLGRAELNFALGRAIFEVAGAGHHKTAWRRRAAAAGARLARLIESQQRHQSPPGSRPAAAGRAPSPPGAPAGRWGEGLATLAAWLLTIGGGAFMLAGWIRRGGLRPRRGRSRLVPAVTLGHVGVASAALLVWIAYLVTGLTGLGWLAVGMLLAAAGLGMATLTAWSSRASRPAAGPPVPASGPPRGPRADLRIIVPIVHGLTASATILLGLLTVVSAR